MVRNQIRGAPRAGGALLVGTEHLAPQELVGDLGLEVGRASLLQLRFPSTQVTIWLLTLCSTVLLVALVADVDHHL
jgi:hypothetical protein